ncbi:putative ripening-related protein 1 [Dioscorea cayenensis subsp. rotundata]|uniref:Ripening-related protein 1 n=1 Tax=Dioscorea cayennensis subsp. rotundata TaxID=55577 RepID=A0AB40CGA8_DIOCR|nr:putative ripening-related protein 1 [Dioscorea cayenensis subsp. rotundata]
MTMYSSEGVAGLVFMVLLLLANINLSMQACNSSGFLNGKSGSCNTDLNAECCKSGEKYPQFKCSPPVTDKTRATMTINSFDEGGDGGGESACDSRFHSDKELVVALSSGWFDDGSRCNKKIRINAKGKSVLAKVVDECDSVNGCDEEHDFQPPCRNNIVDASPAVWKALGITGEDVGELDITWTDA